MSRDSYARGFCKAAAAHGVDPTALAKYAAAMKPANNELKAQRVADMASLRKVMASAKPKGKGIVRWTPEQIAAFNAFAKKHGQPSPEEVYGHA